VLDLEASGFEAEKISTRTGPFAASLRAGGIKAFYFFASTAERLLPRPPAFFLISRECSIGSSGI